MFRNLRKNFRHYMKEFLVGFKNLWHYRIFLDLFMTFKKTFTAEKTFLL